MKRIIGMVAAGLLVVTACGSADSEESDGTTAATEAPAEAEGDAAAEDAVAEDDAAADDAAEEDAAAEDDAAAEEEDAAEDAAAEEAAGEGEDGVLEVPGEFPTISDAVAAAQPGDLVLISPGVYNEAVDVTTDDIVIRGLSREGVVLDGQFELDNGIRVLGANGVAVENLTTQNYTVNGVFWVSSEGYRASYVSAYRNGDYGIYAFDSVKGQIEHSYGAGSPDAGFYIGQCYPCDAVLDNVLAEHNGLGYSGTNSGGNLLIVNSTFRNNRAGVVPNSGSYELCYPERETTIVGNTVHSNNQPDTPAIDVALLAMGNGILTPGGIANVIERNLVFDHDRTGIGLVPFLEESPNDDLPTEDEWTVTCEEQREQPLPDEVPEVLIWDSYDNSVTGNVVSDSGLADLGVAGVGAPTGSLRNCWAGNTVSTTRPADLETIAPCGGEALPADDPAWEVDPLDVVAWLAEVDSQPPAVDFAEAVLPPLPDLEDMPDAATAPAVPARNVPFAVDLDAIGVPPAPGE